MKKAHQYENTISYSMWFIVILKSFYNQMITIIHLKNVEIHFIIINDIWTVDQITKTGYTIMQFPKLWPAINKRQSVVSGQFAVSGQFVDSL